MKNFNTNFVSIALAALLIAAVGIILWQNTVVQEDLDEKDETILSLESQLQETVRQELLTPGNNKAQSSSVSDADFPIVTYEPGGLFSAADKTELEKKLINPYFDFYNEDSVYALTMNIEYPDEEPGSFSVFVTNIDESYASFLYGNTETQSQDWWLPECLGGCDFSNTFKGKYPEIVSAVES